MDVLTPQSTCLVGVARADITPPVGTYHRMWGAASHDVSEGIHRPLTATAIAFAPIGNIAGHSANSAQDEPVKESRQILLAVDHCLFGVDEVDQILDAAAASTGISRQEIAITFSHTHAAGLLNRDRKDLPGGEFIEDYLNSLANSLAEIANQAYSTMTPASIVYGKGRCSLAGHRDFFDSEDQQFVCGFNPEGEADDLVLVAKMEDEEGQLLATIVNYACHPTTLAWDNRLISPDFPGAMRELIENATAAPCVFIQGASGDLGPVEGFVGDTDVADRNGRQLGYAALGALVALPPPNHTYMYDGSVVSGATIGVWQYIENCEQRSADVAAWGVNRDIAPLPYRPDLPRRQEIEEERDQLLKQENAAREKGEVSEAERLRALVERQTRMLGRLRGMPEGDEFPFQVSIWKMGDAIWVCLQGEPYNLLQREVRAAFPDSPIIVATIANGWGPSYLPTRDLYGQGIYQESIASLAPGSLEQLIETLCGRIRELIASPSQR